MKKKRLLVLTGGAAVVALGAGATWWVVGSTATATPATSVAPSASLSAEGEAVAQALELLETSPDRLLPTDLAGTDVTSAIPAGAKVMADPSTWEASTNGGGKIEVELTTADGASSVMVAIMAEEPDGWKVLQTFPLEPAL